MSHSMNVFTAMTLRRKGICQYYLKLLSASLCLCALAVESLNANTPHRTFLLTNRRAAKLLISLFLFLLITFTHAQDIDLLLKNGQVIDPANNINARLDVAITAGKIVRVAAGIATGQAKKVVDVTGLYVCPGFIDIHTHVFVGSKPETFADGSLSLSPDDFT